MVCRSRAIVGAYRFLFYATAASNPGGDDPDKPVDPEKILKYTMKKGKVACAPDGM